MFKLKLAKVHFLKIFVVRKNIKAFLLLFLLFLTQLSCSTTDPKLEPDLKLELKDVSCTEAWLQLTTNNIQLPATINLLKNNTVTQTFSLSTQDSLLYIDSLLPNQNYSFQVSIIQSAGGGPASSNKVTATTLDTTSHNFTWQTFEFGQHSSSTLYDVAIINENNIWAVGEIYMNDSLGQPDSQPYAVAHWDGTNWTLMKVPYHDFNQIINYPGPLFSIAVIEGEIYGVSYANLLKWTGSKWIEKAFFMEQIPFYGQVLKIWGIDENNIYCVGRNGAVYFYFGNNWVKLESGIDLDIYDILGQRTSTGKYDIIAVAANLLISTDKKIIKIENNMVVNLSTAGIPSSIKSIWFKPNKKYYVVGSGMFTKADINSKLGWESIWQGITQYFTGSIDGNDLNDIIVCGSYGELLHFNGVTWKSYQNELQLQAGSYGEVKMKNNLIIAIGHDSQEAVITIGRR